MTPVFVDSGTSQFSGDPSYNYNSDATTICKDINGVPGVLLLLTPLRNFLL